jgi:glycosyltransferase involved in cell wall biosynthesis
MITLSEALNLEQVKNYQAPPVPSLEELSENEKDALEYLDACVEAGVYKSFCGNPINIEIPGHMTTPRIIAVLKQRYEEGGWTVAVLTNVNGDDVVGYQFVITRGKNVSTVEVKSSTKKHRDKPLALLVSDVPGWAFDVNMRDMARYLADDFDFEYFYTTDWFKGARVDWYKYDVIYEAYHRNPEMGIPYERALGAMRSQYFKPEKQGPPDAEDITLVNRYRGFQVATQMNYDELIKRCPNVVYLTNPVDTRRFTQVPKRDRIIASWNGNAGHKSPDGRYIKHFYDVVVPACSKAEVPYVVAEYGTSAGRMRRRTPEEMPEFYQQANVALCASEYEAASNSVMEAMSSGLALIVTDVGNHRELRDSQLKAYGDTGIILVERDVDAFADVIRSLTPDRVFEMGQINRREIEDRWSWELFTPKYKNFLKMAL